MRLLTDQKLPVREVRQILVFIEFERAGSLQIPYDRREV